MCTWEEYGKYSVTFGGPAFVGALSACACSWYQPPASWPGYEATPRLDRLQICKNSSLRVVAGNGGINLNCFYIWFCHGGPHM